MGYIEDLHRRTLVDYADELEIETANAQQESAAGLQALLDEAMTFEDIDVGPEQYDAAIDVVLKKSSEYHAGCQGIGSMIKGVWGAIVSLIGRILKWIARALTFMFGGSSSGKSGASGGAYEKSKTPSGGKTGERSNRRDRANANIANVQDNIGDLTAVIPTEERIKAAEEAVKNASKAEEAKAKAELKKLTDALKHAEDKHAAMELEVIKAYGEDSEKAKIIASATFFPLDVDYRNKHKGLFKDMGRVLTLEDHGKIGNFQGFEDTLADHGALLDAVVKITESAEKLGDSAMEGFKLFIEDKAANKIPGRIKKGSPTHKQLSPDQEARHEDAANQMFADLVSWREEVVDTQLLELFKKEHAVNTPGVTEYYYDSLPGTMRIGLSVDEESLTATPQTGVEAAAIEVDKIDYLPIPPKVAIAYYASMDKRIEKAANTIEKIVKHLEKTMEGLEKSRKGDSNPIGSPIIAVVQWTMDARTALLRTLSSFFAKLTKHLEVVSMITEKHMLMGREWVMKTALETSLEEIKEIYK